MLRAIVAVGLLAGTPLACKSSQSKFCSQLCPAWNTCASTSGSAPPLFCDPATLESTCESACNQAAAELGDSESAFVSCAECTLPFVGNKVCDESMDGAVGQVSCANECTGDVVGNAASMFYATFTAMLGPDVATLSCNATGTQTWNADDPAISHNGGSDAGGGSWSCGGCDCGSHVMYGPYVTLPPGNYVAGFRGVSLTSSSCAQTATGTADVTMNHGATTLATTMVDNTTSEIDMPFTLIAQATEVEVRLATSAQASIGSVFITRM